MSVMSEETVQAIAERNQQRLADAIQKMGTMYSQHKTNFVQKKSTVEAKPSILARWVNGQLT